MSAVETDEDAVVCRLGKCLTMLEGDDLIVPAMHHQQRNFQLSNCIEIVEWVANEEAWYQHLSRETWNIDER